MRKPTAGTNRFICLRVPSQLYMCRSLFQTRPAAIRTHAASAAMCLEAAPSSFASEPEPASLFPIQPPSMSSHSSSHSYPATQPRQTAQTGRVPGARFMGRKRDIGIQFNKTRARRLVVRDCKQNQPSRLCGRPDRSLPLTSPRSPQNGSSLCVETPIRSRCS